MSSQMPTPALAPAGPDSGPHRPPRRWTALLVPAALGSFTAAAALLLVLHLDRRWAAIDPVTAMLSDYAWCPGWWMWDGTLILTSAGSIAVLVALRRMRLLIGWPTVSVLVMWCVSVLAVAVFVKDPQGGAVTPTGKAHLYATGLSCVSLPLAGWLLGRRHRHVPHWARYAGWSRRLALTTLPFFLPFIVPFAANTILGGHLPTVATGLVERLMTIVELVLLIVLALWARRAEPTGPSTPASLLSA